MSMFDNLLFMMILAAVLVPAAVLGLLGVRLKWYGLIATLAILLAVFDSWESRASLAAFYIIELLCVQVYAQVRAKTAKRWVLWVFIAVSVAPLICVKVGAVAPGLAFFRLLGVSYMTFRAVGVLIETYDGLIDDIKVSDFSYFLLFFPSVSSGPIDRYRRFVKDLSETPDKARYFKMLKHGVWNLVTGAVYSFAAGSLIWQYWLMNVPQSGFGATLSYMYGYTFFLFFNFAGYSRMAVGAANVLGIDAPGNFNMPFLSHDMKDFWARWHISLSTWLRDFVYTRFVSAALKGEWFKDRRTSSYWGYALTMMTMGVWHGLTPAYLLYGVYHGALMCVNDLLDTRWKAFRKLKKHPAAEPIFVIVTFHLFSFGLLIFSGRII